MILTKEQLDEYRSELPRSVWNKRCLTNFLDTIADLESRLKAATEKSDCGHPKMFWKEWTATGTEYNSAGYPVPVPELMACCTICAEVQAAYERGLRDAAEYMFCPFEIRNKILALKDRGAKGGRG